ncbi:MAG: hypothetical protein E4H17_04375, partial [Gemmatimonadales bacterium]
MTLPGPIPTGGIPDVKPLFHSQTPTLGAVLTPQIALLQSIMAQNQDKKERQDKLVLNRMAGNALRDVLVAADTDLIPGAGNAAFTANGMPGVQPFQPVSVEGPLAKELKGRPGEAVLAAAPYLTGVISGREARRTDLQQNHLRVVAERAKALAEQGKPSFTHFVTAEGHMAIIDQNLGTGDVARYSAGPKKGQPIPVAKSTDRGPQIGTTPYLDARRGSPTYGQLVPIPEGQSVDPADYIDLKDARSTDAGDAADFYPTIKIAYEQTRNAPPFDPKEHDDVMPFIGTMGRSSANANAYGILAANKTLSPRLRRWLNAQLDLQQAFIYKKSGKAVTAGEFTRAVQSGMPLPWENETSRDEKWARMETQIEGFAGQARGALF